MKKEIKLKENRTIFLDSNQDELIKNDIIVESFFNEEIISAHYLLKRGTEFVFSAGLDTDMENEENQRNLIFLINQDHPLYFPFLHLLDNKMELIIQDEFNDLKSLKIKDNRDVIKLTFTDNDKKSNKRFEIKLKNKLEPYKDKTTRDNNKNKIALNYFFDESKRNIEDGYYQTNDYEYDNKVKRLLKEKK